MTHTLHPEIEKALKDICLSFDLTNEDARYDLLVRKLGPYLLPPSQHLKEDEYLDKEFSKGYDAGVKAARDKLAELEQ